MKSILADRRRALKLSTTEVAHRLGISQSSVIRLEQSEARKAISIDSLERYAAAIGCALTYSITPRFKTLPKKDLHGLSRSKRQDTSRTPSTIEESLYEEVLKLNERLSPSERVSKACELSDVAFEIKKCLNKHS